jgi:hypothetical protein
MTAQIATGRQKFWKISTAQHSKKCCTCTAVRLGSKENGLHVQHLG